MKVLKFEDIELSTFNNYRRVLVFSDNYIEFPEVKNIRYFTLFQLAEIIEDYLELRDITTFEKLPYLFIFDFPYNNSDILSDCIQILNRDYSIS